MEFATAPLSGQRLDRLFLCLGFGVKPQGFFQAYTTPNCTGKMHLDPRLNRTADFIKLMAHAIRLRILILLAEEESLSVSAMMDSLSITQALLSHHLIKMRKGKILLQTRKGREIHYSVSDPALVALLIKLLRAYH